jgi:hypothetical protein
MASTAAADSAMSRSQSGGAGSGAAGGAPAQGALSRTTGWYAESAMWPQLVPSYEPCIDALARRDGGMLA